MLTKKVETPWENIPADLQLEDCAGFVYLIVNTLSQKKYIGRKYLWKITKKKVKGSKRKIKVKSESDWRYYKSSSKELQEDIKNLGIHNFRFIILSFHKTRAEVNYTEVKEQFSRDVLYSKLGDDYEFYNYCILSRYYRKLPEGEIV